MTKRLVCLLVVMTLCLGSSGRVWAAPDDESFHAAARRALDEYERQQTQAIEEVSASAPDRSSSGPDRSALPSTKAHLGASHDGLEPALQPEETPKTSGKKDKKLEIALQMASYLFDLDEKVPFYYSKTYSTPDQVKKNGSLFGLYGSYTWKMFEPLRSWKDFRKIVPFPTVVKIEADLSQGRTEYDSFVTGKRKGFDAWEIDARVLAGIEVQMGPSTILTPYLGVGYWRYTDNTGGWVDYFVYNYAEYSTKYNFFYLPVGVEGAQKLNKDWDFNMKLEGDLILDGDVEYYLTDIPGPFTGYHDADTGAPLLLEPRNAKSKLNGGYGFRTSGKLIKKCKDFNFFVEPFLKFWSINKSEPQQVHSFDIWTQKDYVSVYPDKTPYKPLWDPKSQTVVSGVRMGVQF